MSELECARHFKARPKTICLVCKERIYSDTEICNSHSGIYKNAWYEGKKVKIESDMVETSS